MTEEIWKDIKGYEGYQVSNLGNVRSLNYRHTNKVKTLNPHTNNKGYLLINLYQMGKMKTFQIHRLVAQTFIPNQDNLPLVNHKDENKQNNCVENLEWCTHKYNVNYGNSIEKMKLKKIGSNNYKSKIVFQYTKDGEFIKSWDSTMDVQRGLGIPASNIGSCARGEVQSSHGYIWKYKRVA